MNLSQRKEFIWYFRKRLESLDYCNATFENTVRDEIDTMMDGVNKGRIQSNDPELSVAFAKLNYLIPSTFRNCMIVGACTLIEDILLLIGSYTVPGFESHVGRLSNMSKIRKYLSVLGDEIPMDFTTIDRQLQLIYDIVKIRNAIVHRWGKIDNCNNHIALRNIISQRNWVEETGDGYIFLNDEADKSSRPHQDGLHQALDYPSKRRHRGSRLSEGN